MKVLQINSVINSGSTGRIAEEIGQELINIGHESYIAYGRNNANSNSVKIKIGTKWDIYLHGISSRIFDNHGLCSSNATKILIKDIQSVNPDIIHLHNLHGYYLNYQLLFKFLNEFNKPIVWTLHDCWSITGHCSHFDFIGCNKWKNECYECPELKQYPKSIFYDRSTRNYVLKKELFNSIDKLMLVPVSDWLRKKITTSFMASTNVKVINNGINTSIFKPVSSSKRKDLNIVNEVVLLGVASVWHERKGFKEFLKLSKIMPENYRIILVGVKKNQSKLLPQNIIGIERTESVEDLAEIYSIADVFVNPFCFFSIIPRCLKKELP
jgi:glycosyltransferase involved in cell wall biosynthesis